MYVQVDGVMMGSPLGPLFANIFMSELDNTIIPTLGNKVLHWKRYVDDTFALIKPDTANEIQHILNSFHNKIKFTYEYEQSNTISFLDVLVTRSNNGTLQTSVYRKKTNRCVPQLEYTHTYSMKDLNNQKPGQTSILYLINRNSAEPRVIPPAKSIHLESSKALKAG